MIPTGWYSWTQSILILLGVALAFMGADRRLWWPAGAMLLSLVSARLATGLEAYTLPILLVATPICAMIAARPVVVLWESRPPITPPSRRYAIEVIAATYIPRLLCYGAYALGLVPLWAMWEFSNFFLWVQIIALFTGAIGGGNLARYGGSVASSLRPRPVTGGGISSVARDHDKPRA